MKSAFAAINAHYIQTSLALRQIRSHAQTTRYFEFNINQPFRSIVDELIAYEPDIIGFSCYIWNVDLALKLARALKAALPDIIVAVGGPETAYDPCYYISNHQEIDYVLTGEGEIVWPSFLQQLETKGTAFDLDGVTSRDVDGHPKQNFPAPFLSPDQWLYPYQSGEIAELRHRLTYIETSRGCPFRCAYCLSGGHKLRMMSAEKSITFLCRMADEGAKIIKLVDRTFNADISRAIKIWEALKQRSASWPQKPVFHFEIMARMLNEQALQCLETAPVGLFQLEIGVQTTDPNVLGAVGRIDDYEKITAIVHRLMKKNNMHIHVDLIAGLPGETIKTFSKSFDDVWNMGAHMLQLGFLKLLRGSELRLHAHQLGLRFDPDPPYEIEATAQISARELGITRRIEELLDAYANSGKYPCTMCLITSDRSAWSLFDSLRVYYTDHGLFNRGLSQADRTRALYDFALKMLTVNPIWLSACIRHDCISRGGRLELPDELIHSMTETDKTALHEYVTPIRGQWIEHYHSDIASFWKARNTRYFNETNCSILYDPRNRKWFTLDPELHIQEEHACKGMFTGS